MANIKYSSTGGRVVHIVQPYAKTGWTGYTWCERFGTEIDRDNEPVCKLCLRAIQKQLDDAADILNEIGVK